MITLTNIPLIPNYAIMAHKAPALQVNTSSGSTIDIDDCFIQYIDLIASLLGIDIKYEDFSKMSDADRRAYIREIKLKKLDI